jgi:hypothetical protein
MAMRLSCLYLLSSTLLLIATPATVAAWEQPRTETPQQAVANLFKGLLGGDPETIRSSIDTTTPAGKTAAKTVIEASEMMKSAPNATKSAADKFGPAGEQLVQEKFFLLGNMPRFSASELDQIDEGIDKEVEVYWNENRDKAIVYMPDNLDRFWRVAQRDGQWRLTVDEDGEEVSLLNMPTSEIAAVLKKVPIAVEDSETIDQFRERLDKMLAEEFFKDLPEIK